MGLGTKFYKWLDINLPAKYQWAGSALFAVLLLAVAALILYLVMAILSAHPARAAEENGWFTADQIYLYLDEAGDQGASFCVNSRRDLTSNLGADVTIYKRNALEWHAHFAHHSCAFGPDAPNYYNALGTGIVWKFERHGWFWDKAQ
jgi:hypothetical protein